MDNLKIKKAYLSKITKKTFKDAIFLAYKDGITSIAPLGFSGSTIILHGKSDEITSRISQVSIRNYCGSVELLITDKKGSFLFYGRYDIGMGLDFVLEQYWQIFNNVKVNIKKIMKKTEFKDMKIAKDVKISAGFRILSAYQKELLTNKPT